MRYNTNTIKGRSPPMYPLIRPVSAPGRCVLSAALRGVLGAQRRGACVHRPDPAGIQQQGVGAAYRQPAGADAGGGVLHCGLPRAGPGLAAARRGGLGGWCCPPCFCTTSILGLSQSGTTRAAPQLQLVPRRRHDVPTRRAGKNQLYFDIGAAFEQRARPGQ